MKTRIFLSIAATACLLFSCAVLDDVYLRNQVGAEVTVHCEKESGETIDGAIAAGDTLYLGRVSSGYTGPIIWDTDALKRHFTVIDVSGGKTMDIDGFTDTDIDNDGSGVVYVNIN